MNNYINLCYSIIGDFKIKTVKTLQQLNVKAINKFGKPIKESSSCGIHTAKNILLFYYDKAHLINDEKTFQDFGLKCIYTGNTWYNQITGILENAMKKEDLNELKSKIFILFWTMEPEEVFQNNSPDKFIKFLKNKSPQKLFIIGNCLGAPAHAIAFMLEKKINNEIIINVANSYGTLGNYGCIEAIKKYIDYAKKIILKTI